MAKEKISKAESLMTEIIDKVNQIDKDDPLMQYVRERMEVCNCLCQNGLLNRSLIEIKHILINLEKRLEV